jgi:uncharacterized cupin superfamily protein
VGVAKAGIHAKEIEPGAKVVQHALQAKEQDKSDEK